MYNTNFGNLVIANGGTKSTEFTDARALGNLHRMTVIAPAALTGTVKVEVAVTAVPVDGDYRTLQVDGADVAIAAGKAVTFWASGYTGFRLVSSGAEGAERTFTIMGQTHK